MFETREFGDRLSREISNVALAYGTTVEPTIPGVLQDIALQNEAILMERERLRPITERRGIPEAIGSARIIIADAAGYARSARRTQISVADVSEAIRIKFCQLWPFCR